jgi:hypothetical protein
VPSQQIADASHFASHRGLLSTTSDPASADLATFAAHDRAIMTEKHRVDAEARALQCSLVPLEERVVKPPKDKYSSRPHQASGRQLEDVLAIRLSLRQGFHRYTSVWYTSV